VMRKYRALARFLSALVRLGIAILPILLVAKPAYAHGEVGPAELGPPLFVSVALAVISYWIVMLWPRRPEDESQGDEPDEDDGSGGGGYPAAPRNFTREADKVRLLVRLSTRDRVPVLAGHDESEGVDHGEERVATHSSGSYLYVYDCTRSLWARRSRR